MRKYAIIHLSFIKKRYVNMHAPIKSLAVIAALGLTVTLSACGDNGPSASGPGSLASASANSSNAAGDVSAPQKAAIEALQALKSNDLKRLFADTYVEDDDPNTLAQDAQQYVNSRLNAGANIKSWKITGEAPKDDGNSDDTDEITVSVHYTDNAGNSRDIHVTARQAAEGSSQYKVENLLPEISAGAFIYGTDAQGLNKEGLKSFKPKYLNDDEVAYKDEKVFLIEADGTQVQYSTGERSGNLLPGTYKFRITATVVGQEEDPDSGNTTELKLGTFDKTFTTDFGTTGTYGTPLASDDDTNAASDDELTSP
jgi:predicted small lipoprotein YifL